MILRLVQAYDHNNKLSLRRSLFICMADVKILCLIV